MFRDALIVHYHGLPPRKRRILLDWLAHGVPEVAVALAAHYSPSGCEVAREWLVRDARKKAADALERLLGRADLQTLVDSAVAATATTEG